MKLIVAILVFVIFVCSFNMPETMRVAWYITLPIVYYDGVLLVPDILVKVFMIR